MGVGHRRMRRVRRLLRGASARWAEGAFVIEGPELVRTALDAGVAVEECYVGPRADRSADAGGALDAARAAGVRVFPVAAGVLERVSDTVSPQPLLAVARFVGTDWRVLVDADLVVVLMDVRDPGNLGTILRTADAAGASGVVVCRGSVDVYNPKVVRASAGSIFHVPLWVGADPTEALDALGDHGLRTVAALRADATDYVDVEWATPTALCFGNEAAGLPADVVARADVTATVPMAGRAESLNVATACAVMCFEALRQRRRSPGRPYHAPMPDQEQRR